MWFGGPDDGWYGGECQTCVPPGSFDYKGAWWGWIDGCGTISLTRLPEAIGSNTWLDDAGQLNVVHETDSVALENIERDGVEYKCVGVSGSQIGEAPWAKGISGSFVWYQTNWRPVNDASAAPVAGLARVRIASGMDAPTSQADPANHEFTLEESFLIDGTDGEPFRWDERHKLCHHFDHDSTTGYSRKTLTGPGHFVFQERRIAGKIRITYWTPGNAAPTVSEWDNPEDQENETGWPVLFFDKHAFPFGIATQFEAKERFPDGELKVARRLYRQGKCTLAGALGPTSSDEANAGSVLAVGRDPELTGGSAPSVNDYAQAFALATFAKDAQVSGVSTLTPSSTRVYFVDAVCHGSMQPHLTDNQGRTVEYQWYPDGWAKTYGPGYPQVFSNYSYGFAAIVTARGNHDPLNPNTSTVAHGPQFTLRDQDQLRSLPGYSVFTLSSLFDENFIGARTGFGVGNNGRHDYAMPGGPIRLWAASHNATVPGQIGVYNSGAGVSDPGGPLESEMSIRPQTGETVTYGLPLSADTEFAEEPIAPWVYFATESAFANGYDTFGGDPLFTFHGSVNASEGQSLVEGSPWIPNSAPRGPEDPSCSRWLYKVSRNSDNGNLELSHERLPQYASDEGGQFRIKGVWWDTNGDAQDDGRLDWGGSLDPLHRGFKPNPSPTPGL